jgi:heme exporter protein A
MSGRHLRVAKVSKDYGRQRALSDVSVTFSPAQVTAVVGPNGAGKTTLLGILSTLVRPTRGEVFLNDELLTHNARECIGYVGHEAGVYPELSASLYTVPEPETRIDAMLDRVGLAPVRSDLPARAYSRGMLQRLALARALLHNPDILLFDEPSSALDPSGARWLVEELVREGEAGRTVILVTHDLETAAKAARHIVVIRRGRVALDHTEKDGYTTSDVRALYQEALREA